MSFNDYLRGIYVHRILWWCGIVLLASTCSMYVNEDWTVKLLGSVCISRCCVDKSDCGYANLFIVILLSYVLLFISCIKGKTYRNRIYHTSALYWVFRTATLVITSILILVTLYLFIISGLILLFIIGDCGETANLFAIKAM